MTTRTVWLGIGAVAVVTIAVRIATCTSNRGDEAASTAGSAVINRPTGVIGTGPAKLKGERARSEVGALRLEGQVIDEHQQPVAGAQVTLFTREPKRATAEDDGTFVFENLAPGPYKVRAYKDAQSSDLVRTRLSETSEPVTLRMHLGATLVIHHGCFHQRTGLLAY